MNKTLFLGNMNEQDIKVGMKVISYRGMAGEITHVEDGRDGLDIGILWENGAKSQIWHLWEYANPKIKVILK